MQSYWALWLLEMQVIVNLCWSLTWLFVKSREQVRVFHWRENKWWCFIHIYYFKVLLCLLIIGFLTLSIVRLWLTFMTILKIWWPVRFGSEIVQGLYFIEKECTFRPGVILLNVKLVSGHRLIIIFTALLVCLSFELYLLVFMLLGAKYFIFTIFIIRPWKLLLTLSRPESVVMLVLFIFIQFSNWIFLRLFTDVNLLRKLYFGLTQEVGHVLLLLSFLF